MTGREENAAYGDLVEKARDAAKTEMARYLKLSPGERGHLEKFGVLPDVPSLAGLIDALCEQVELSEREREAWEKHGQEETFARERLERELRGSS